MPTYNKLVRDKIPEIIEANGRKCTTRILSDEEYVTELRKKSYEELDEYMSASDNKSSLEELADLLEIIHSLAKTHGSTIEEVEEIRELKSKDRGGFQDKIFLVDVLEN